MSNQKIKAQSRVFAAVLSVVMVFSMIPMSFVSFAATEAYPDAVTVTVVDEDGNAIPGAVVEYDISSQSTGDLIAEDKEVICDENGTVEIIKAEDFVEGDLLFSATVNCDEYNVAVIEEAVIPAADEDYKVTLVSSIISDVEIIALNSEFDGNEHKLVSVTEIEGDTVTYKVNGESVPEAVATDAGEYVVEVTVAREGKETLVETVKATIFAIDMGMDMEAAEGLVYEGDDASHALVTVTGEILESDTVVWTVNGSVVEGREVPTAYAVGTYKVMLTVERKNYIKFEKEVEVQIGLGNLELGDLVIEPNDFTYDGEAHEAVKIENKGDYTLMFSDSADGSWSEEVPLLENAGTYEIYVKAVKESYNDKETEAFPVSVTVSPKAQELSFDNYAGEEKTEIIEGSVPYDKTFDFKATGSDECGGEITYSVELSEDGIASIDENGILSVFYPGTITVKADLSNGDNANYSTESVSYKLVIKGNASNKGQFIHFEEEKVEYTVGTSDVVSTLQALKKNDRVDGSVTYSLSAEPGIVIDENGKVTVADYAALVDAVSEADGSLEIVVTATKSAGDKYGENTAEYSIIITLEKAPDEAYILPEADGTEGWYITEGGITVSAPEGYFIAKTVEELVNNEWDSVVFDTQGQNAYAVYLRNAESGAITGAVAVVDADGEDLKYDSVKPDVNKMAIEYSQVGFFAKLGELLGIYNPQITITFTAEQDETSGIHHFDWKYTRSEGASEANLEADGGTLDVAVEDNVVTATLTLPKNEAEQLHGNISFTATDKAGNESASRADDYVFIVDTIAPQITSVKYQGADLYGNAVNSIGTVHYFNTDVECQFTIKETNFSEDSVIIRVSKDGEEAEPVEAVWTDGDADEHIATFTLEGDGDYIVCIEYKDYANNVMEEYESEIICIDKTAPVVTVEYIRENVEGEDVQKTVFTVEEHNFMASGITVEGTMVDIKGAPVDFTAAELTDILRNAEWTQNGDVYSFEYKEYVDGIYDLTVDYVDAAKWEAESFKADQFIVDHTAPDHENIEIEYSKSIMDTILPILTLGFYNPDVTVTFTAYDMTAGVESFVWSYAKQEGASIIAHPEMIEETAVEAVQDDNDPTKFTGEFTLTATEAEQYRGNITVAAVDSYENKSEKITDEGYVVVVDTIAPTLSVEYTVADRYVESTDNYYYNNEVNVIFRVTEANFFPEDVVVTVTRDGEVFEIGDILWGERNEEDVTIGTFTLKAPEDHSGDGDYVITVDYKDRSENEMVTYVSATHTIDTIAPVVKVDYLNKNVINTLKDAENADRKYFDDTQTATITFTEHNFNAQEVDLIVTPKDVTGKVLEDAGLYEVSQWTQNGDVYTVTVTYPGDANYTFDVEYQDLATNSIADYAPDHFTVDKTAPVRLTVGYSTSVLETVLESVTFGFYNAKMTVTITAEDITSGVHSFLYSYLTADGVSEVNAELTEQIINAADITYSEDNKTATATFEIPKLVLGDDNQFNGTVEFSATDRAGNASDVHEEEKRVVVDNIAPKASVSYNQPVNTEAGVSYYDGAITATLTVTEANFYAEDVQVTVTANGAARAVTPTWVNNGNDVHTGTFTITGDGDYVVTVNYTDKSSNRMVTYTSNQLTVDTAITAPAYKINGQNKTEIGGAYKGDAVVEFSFADQNFNANTVKLVKTRFDSVEDVTEQFVSVISNAKGGSGKFEIPAEEANDGIYVLTIGMNDKANHSTESSIMFTVNRFGSVYSYNETLCELIKDGGQFVTEVDEDIVITEYNAVKLDKDSLKILITRDGESIDAEYTTTPAKIDETAELGESGWYQYVYTIKASTFSEDGVYKISLSSAYTADDAAGNESTSVPENSINGEGNKVVDVMGFTVDATAPELRNVVNLEKAIVNAQSIDVKYTVVDVGGIKSIEIIVDGVTIDTITEFEDSIYNYSGKFTIKEKTDAQTVQIRITDLAGNVTDTAADDFSTGDLYVFNHKVTVSTNFFVRWYANKGLFWGTVGGAAGLIALAVVLVVVLRKKKEEKAK